MDVVTILGAGSHGRDIECIAIDCGWFVEFRDDDPAKGFEPCSALKPDERFVVGAWEPRLRLHMWDQTPDYSGDRYLVRPERNGVTLIHPAARVGRDCTIGAGCVIGPGAILTNDVNLGAHVHVGAGAILTRCSVGSFSTISNGATVLGDVTIGSTVLVGGNAVVRNLLTVGDGAVIGCGANVIRDVEPNTAVAGNPAKTLGIVP